MADPNQTLLVIGYGSLLSGYGLLADRRGRVSRLLACDAFPVVLHNARRGLAKPSSHGRYLAMDLEPIDPRIPITAHTDRSDATPGIGALGLVFERRWAGHIARREEYSADKFIELIATADRACQPLGDFLYEIAKRADLDFGEYRRKLRGLLAYTSPGYIFHPLPLEDGRYALVAIGSGYGGSGDPAVCSRRGECGMDRLLTLAEALRVTHIALDRSDQIGYFAECVLGGMHGVHVGDLMAGIHDDTMLAEELAHRVRAAAFGEQQRFLTATSLDADGYRLRFPEAPDPSFRALLNHHPTAE